MRDPDLRIAGERSFSDGIILPQIGLCSEPGVIVEKVHPGALDLPVLNPGEPIRRAGDLSAS